MLLLFIQRYNLYHRRFPPKDQINVQDLTALGERHEHIAHIKCHILHVFNVLHTFLILLILHIESA